MTKAWGCSWYPNKQFLMVPLEIMERFDVSLIDVAVFAVLADESRGEGFVSIGVRRICELTGESDRTVTRIIGKLERAGLIEVERPGSGKRNIYRPGPESARKCTALARTSAPQNYDASACETPPDDPRNYDASARECTARPYHTSFPDSRPAAEPAQGSRAEAEAEVDPEILALLAKHGIGEPKLSDLATRCTAQGLGCHDVEQKLGEFSESAKAGAKVNGLEEWLDSAEKEAARKEACRKHCEGIVGEIEAQYQQQESPKDPEEILCRVLSGEWEEVIVQARPHLTSKLRSNSDYTDQEVATFARSCLEDESKPGVRNMLAQIASRGGYLKLPAKPAEQDDTTTTNPEEPVLANAGGLSQ